MKRVGILLIVGLLFSSLAYGAELKIGYVNLQKALNESEGGRKAKADLDEIIKAKQVVIDKKGKELEKLKADLDKQSALLSEDAKKAKQEDLDRRMRDFQRFVQDAQAEVKKRESEFTNELLKDLRKIIAAIGKEEHYTLILERVEGFILYADKSIDLTGKVISKYNEKMKDGK
ncbi:Outer membrane protein H precursor [hydrothermal vent metagenome]|uniref:Outer membrane protein H n=1 Tax=hydrothermal vent metagenome TaxID=652676 RepID=A0A3B1D7F6_9ZZZZ